MAFSTPISTSAPSTNVFPTYANPLVPMPSATISSATSGPLPTNAWFNDWFVDGAAGTSSYNGPSSKKLNVFPYMLRYRANGLDACIPKSSPDWTAVAIINEMRRDMSFHAVEAINSTRITSFTDFSVTLQWDGAAGNMAAPVVRGMAYVTMQYSGLTPRIYTGNAVAAWPADADNHSRSFTVNGQSSGTVTGTRFTVVTTGVPRSGYPKVGSHPVEYNDTQSWILYASSSISLTIGSEPLENDVVASTLTATAAYTGTLRFVRVQNPAEEAIYDTRSGVVPTGGTVNVTYAGNTATETYTFTTTGGSDLIHFALPHHQQRLVSPTNIGITWQTLRGTMQAVSGTVWQINDPLPSISFHAVNAVPGDKIAAIQNAVLADIDYPYPSGLSNSDIYNAGKAYGALARLVLVADSIGDTASRTTILNKLRTNLTAWFDGAEKRFYYDTTWGGVIAEASRGNGANSHGNGYYNDHHYHWGYMIYAAAVLAHFDPSWANPAIRDSVNTLVRDIANPSASDTYFARFRHTDWFEGHSWPAGLASAEDGRNQESTSEATNAWYGVALWGQAIGNTDIENNGRLLLAKEVQATHTYWFMPTASGIYPAGVMKSKKTIGIVAQNKVTTDTWFGSNPEYHTGIQALPFTPISEVHLEPNWALEAWTSRLAPNTPSGTTQSWLGYNYSLQAVNDPDTAWTNIAALTGSTGASSQWDWEGTTKANLLWWAATRSGATGSGSVPGVVNNLTSTGKTTTTVSLSWSAGLGATSYRIERRTGGGAWENPQVTTALSFTVTGLAASTAYEFQVFAVNASGDAPASSALSVTTDAAATQPPVQVNGLSSPSKTDTTVGLTWNAATYATSYRVEYQVSGAGSWTAFPPDTAITNATVIGLVASTDYVFRVVAINDYGEAIPSLTVAVTTNASGGTGQPIASGGPIGTNISQTIYAPLARALPVTIVRMGANDQNYTVSPADDIVGISALTASRIITLPAASKAGRQLTIKDETGACTATRTITVQGTIDGSSNIVLSTAYAKVVLYDNGSTWSRIL